jgi:Skp family chaperone for outer membrane proteins
MIQPRLNRLMLLAPLVVAGVAAAVFAAGGAQPVPAAAGVPGGTPRVAVFNLSRVFTEMKELKAFNAKLDEEKAKFVATRNQKKFEIEQTLKSRNDMRPDHPQYEELNNRLMGLQTEAEVWVKTQAAVNEQRYKRQTKLLYEKVQAAVADVARQQQIDLVIADNNRSLPEGEELEKADLRAIQAAIYQKDIFYASGRLDITSAVLNHLDAKFQAGGPPAAAAPGAGHGAIPAAAGVGPR